MCDLCGTYQQSVEDGIHRSWEQDRDGGAVAEKSNLEEEQEYLKSRSKT